MKDLQVTIQSWLDCPEAAKTNSNKQRTTAILWPLYMW